MDSDTCSICHEDLNNGQPKTTLECFHCYHTKCILTWFSKNNQCPYCRKVAIPEDVKQDELTIEDRLTYILLQHYAKGPIEFMNCCRKMTISNELMKSFKLMIRVLFNKNPECRRLDKQRLFNNHKLIEQVKIANSARRRLMNLEIYRYYAIEHNKSKQVQQKTNIVQERWNRQMFNDYLEIQRIHRARPDYPGGAIWQI